MAAAAFCWPPAAQLWATAQHTTHQGTSVDISGGDLLALHGTAFMWPQHCTGHPIKPHWWSLLTSNENNRLVTLRPILSRAACAGHLCSAVWSAVHSVIWHGLFQTPLSTLQCCTWLWCLAAVSSPQARPRNALDIMQGAHGSARCLSSASQRCI